MNRIKVARELIRIAKEIAGFIRSVPGIERMPLNQIAKLIIEDYKKQGKRPDYYTKVGLETMLRFKDIHDNWILMQGYEAVRDLVDDISDWEGDLAIEVRSELKRRLKKYMQER